MSGGSHNYTYSRVQEEYVGRMYDVIMDEMMLDLSYLLKQLEWWQSSDISEADYRLVVQEFKEKYFQNYGETSKAIIIRAVNELMEDAGLFE